MFDGKGKPHLISPLPFWFADVAGNSPQQRKPCVSRLHGLIPKAPSRRTLLLAASLAPVFGSRWEEQHFPDWDEKFIEKLVSDSPWARPWKGTTFQELREKQLISSSFFQLGV